MKLRLVFLLIILAGLKGFSQGKIKATIASTDTADLSILDVRPNSFPNVSVVFRAQSRKGEPIWNLAKGNMRVLENSQHCNVVSLAPISKNTPLNLSIVIDHSASMLIDYSSGYGYGEVLVTANAGTPVSTPIDNAKAAVKKFSKSFNNQKDLIGIIGFSAFTDRKLPLTNNINAINAIVDSMEADYSTALYDAMIDGVDQLRNATGIKVLVALTDGYDNTSKSKYKDVIDKAIAQNIPVYIIGMGDVNKDTLQLIANSTKGQFYYTQSSASLDTIYALISKQVQAFYELVYRSPNFSSIDSTREVEISFDIDSIYLVTNPVKINLPQEVITYLEKRETRKEYYLYGGIALAILITSGLLLFKYRKTKPVDSNPVITQLYPNPTSGRINLAFTSRPAQLQIFNMSGHAVKTYLIAGKATSLDLSMLPKGTYIAVITAEGKQSNSMKFVIQ